MARMLYQQPVTKKIMKTQIKIVLLLLVSNFAFAQYPILTTSSFANPADNMRNGNNGNYAIDTNNERDQYVGMWEYNMNGTLFQLKIQKVDQFLSSTITVDNPGSYSYKDVVVFSYRLIKNGVTLFDNLTQDVSTSYSCATKRATEPYLHGRFIEYYRGVNTSCQITKLCTTPEKIIFNISRNTYSLNKPKLFYQDGLPLFFIPANGIEMVKI